MIEGKNTAIRPLKENEVGYFFSLLEKASLKDEYFPFPVESEYNFKKRYASCGFWQESFGIAAIINMDNDFIGMITYDKCTFLEAYELKYIIFDEENRAKGYMKESLKLFSKHLFEKSRINRLQLAIPDYHRASIAVAQKCGYTFEGIGRQAVFFKGKYLDVCIYSLLRREINH